MKKLALLVALALAVPMVAACGGNQSQQPTSAPVPQTVEVTVEILGNRYEPQELTIPAGSRVTFRNTTSAQHGVQCEEAGINALLEGGQQAWYDFETPGTYEVTSSTHTAAPDLHVTIVVE
jgi:plastocyanin